MTLETYFGLVYTVTVVLLLALALHALWKMGP